jgi:hypothetical protein
LTTVVLAVLAVAWGTVLFFWFRSRNQGAFSDSVGLFHRHLHVLERAAPGTLAPANRMRGPIAGPTPLSTRMAPPHLAFTQYAPTQYAPTQYASTQYASTEYLQSQTGPPPAWPRAVASPSARARVASSARRRRTQRRRRDVLFVLTVLVVATLVLAVGTGSHKLMLAQILTDLVLAGYVALLIRLRNLAAERGMKLRVLHRPAQTRVRPARYAPAAGYGDLALRQVAN